jgi:hypothetical protein
MAEATNRLATWSPEVKKVVKRMSYDRLTDDKNLL